MKLHRSSDEMIGGVCAGVAETYNLDTSVVRLIWALLAVCYGVGILLYILMWIILPED